MLVCSNQDCRHPIKREAAIFCPYCGAAVPMNGGMISDNQAADSFASFGAMLGEIEQPNLVDFELSDPVRRAYAYADKLVCDLDEEIVVLDLAKTVQTRKLVVLWRRELTAHKIAILRPYLFLLTGGTLSWYKLDSGKHCGTVELGSDFASIAAPENIALHPIDYCKNAERQARLLIIHRGQIRSLAFTGKHERAPDLDRSFRVNFENDISAIGLDHLGLLRIFSRGGETAEINLPESFRAGFSRSGTIERSHLDLTPGTFVEWGGRIRSTSAYVARSKGDNVNLYVERATANGTSQPVVRAARMATNQVPLVLYSDNSVIWLDSRDDNTLLALDCRELDLRRLLPGFSDALDLEPSEIRLRTDALYKVGGRVFGVFPKLRGNGNQPHLLCLCELIFEPSSYRLKNHYVFRMNLSTLDQHRSNLPLIFANGRFITYYERSLAVITATGSGGES